MNQAERDSPETRKARARYDRLAAVYDLMQSPMERGGSSRWRELLWESVRGSRILEVGVGTGRNFPYYPRNASVTAIDLSPKMLERARRKAEHDEVLVNLWLMDVQRLEFPDDTFDSVVATFVFCSVPDPIQGLRELGRVTKTDGRILLLEHMRPPGLPGKLTDILNPIIVRVWGANINRRTIDNVERAGLKTERVENLWANVVKLIVAQPEK